MFNSINQTLTYLITLTVVGLALTGCMVHPSGYACDPNVYADEAAAEEALDDEAGLPPCGDDEYVTESTALKAGSNQLKGYQVDNFSAKGGAKKAKAKHGKKAGAKSTDSKKDSTDGSMSEAGTAKEAKGTLVRVNDPESRNGYTQCSARIDLAERCEQRNGTSWQDVIPGPDGGECQLTGTNENCSVSYAPGRCCICIFNILGRTGDCVANGSTSSFSDYGPETF